MEFQLQKYDESFYRAQSEETRLNLVKTLVFSDYPQKISILKKIYPKESNIEIKFEIRSAIDLFFAIDPLSSINSKY